MNVKIAEQAFHLMNNQEKIGELTFVPYSQNIIDANHTWIEPEYRGQDLGLTLVEALADYARQQQLHVLPSCPYVAKIFKNEEKYHDIWFQNK